MLPPRMVRRRLAIQIGEFLDWLAGIYAERGWHFGEIVTQPSGAGGADIESWETRDATIAVQERDDDGRIRSFRLTLRNIPSAVDRVMPGSTRRRPGASSPSGDPVVGWEHDFELLIPPAYPSDLRCRFLNLTDSVHPRMLPPEREAPACIFPQADIDGTLRELLWNLLFRPDMVRPPDRFDGADPGFRPILMRWYVEYGPDRMHGELMEAWAERQQRFVEAAATASGNDTGGAAAAVSSSPGATEVAQPAPATPSPFRIIADSEEEANDDVEAEPPAVAGDRAAAGDDREPPPHTPPKSRPPRSLFAILDDEPDE